jgi:hypothetical protein
VSNERAQAEARTPSEQVRTAVKQSANKAQATFEAEIDQLHMWAPDASTPHMSDCWWL